MGKLAKLLAEKITLELKLDKNKQEVIEYGAFALIQIILSIFLVLIIGYAFGVALEAFMISIIASLLRKYSGGVHASLPEICTAICLVVSVGGALIIKIFNYNLITLKTVAIIGVIVFIWAFYIINKYAPVDTPAKPIKTLNKKQRMKKKSIFILTISIIIVLIFIVQYILKNNKISFNYILCIYMGISWQCFTLTNIGHIVIRRIDLFFYNIIKKFKGEDTYEKI